jgi:hypothetical protein
MVFGLDRNQLGCAAKGVKAGARLQQAGQRSCTPKGEALWWRSYPIGRLAFRTHNRNVTGSSHLEDNGV